jgi:hypothetical protein
MNIYLGWDFGTPHSAAVALHILCQFDNWSMYTNVKGAACHFVPYLTLTPNALGNTVTCPTHSSLSLEVFI